MAIEKGQPWGEPGYFPPDAPVVSTDAAIAALVAMGQLGNPSSRPVVLGVEGGDLARTLGVRGSFDPTGPKQMLPVDVVLIELDRGERHVCVAHAVAGDLLRTRPTVAIMNGAFIGHRNIAPRAHPGDGKVDVVRFDLSLGDRFKARKRMTTGTHVPHPGIKVSRRGSGVIELGQRRTITIDGQRRGRSTTVQYTVVPEAITIAVS